MKPTENLIQEHNAIVVMLSIMDKVADIIRNGREVDIEDVAKIVDFLRIFADKCHHGKEERVLFPELIAAGVPEENGPIGIMLREHETGREYINEINSGVEKFKEEGTGSLLLIARGISNYTFLLRNHMNKENNVLFPMADMLLSYKKQADIAKRFNMIEKEIVAGDIHQRYYRILKSLKDRYLIDYLESVCEK